MNNNAINFLELEGLNLPQDVLENSGYAVQLIGELTGDADEIVVLSQMGRRVGSAYVCHLSSGYEARNKDVACKVVCDIPIKDYPKLIIPKHMEDIDIKEFNGVKYTMACLANQGYDKAWANWLF